MGKKKMLKFISLTFLFSESKHNKQTPGVSTMRISSKDISLEPGCSTINIVEVQCRTTQSLADVKSALMIPIYPWIKSTWLHLGKQMCSAFFFYLNISLLPLYGL